MIAKGLMFLVIALFIAILFLNVFFRVRIFKVYKRLVQNKVEFDSSHFFNSEKREREVLSRYPQHKDDIEYFISQIHLSVQIASILIVLIIAAGFLLRQV